MNTCAELDPNRVFTPRNDKRDIAPLSLIHIFGDTVVETAHNILGVVAECCSVDCTKGRGGKPVLEDTGRNYDGNLQT